MNDNDILKLYITRSEQAIAKTQEKYGAYLHTIAMNITSSNRDAEECVNDSIFKAWESIPPLMPNSLKNYLGTVIRNIALDRYRKQHTLKRNPTFEVILDELEEFLSAGDTVEKAMESSSISKSISTYLLSVSKEKRYIFVCRYYYSEKIEFIAKQLHLSKSNVKTILFRMRTDLKEHLKKEDILL